MSSQVISYRLTDEELSALKPQQISGESLNQTAQRVMRDKLGFPTLQPTGISHQEVTDIVDSRLNNAFSALEARLSKLEGYAGIEAIEVSTLEVSQSEAPTTQFEESQPIDEQNNIDNLESKLVEARDTVLSKWKVVKGAETKERISLALNKFIDAIIKLGHA
jgi:hypothetical protein